MVHVLARTVNVIALSIDPKLPRVDPVGALLLPRKNVNNAEIQMQSVIVRRHVPNDPRALPKKEDGDVFNARRSFKDMVIMVHP